MQRVAQLLIALRDRQKQVFIISHDTELLEQCADGIIMLNNGQLDGIYRMR